MVLIVIAIIVVELVFVICFGYLHFKMIHIVFIKNKSYSDKTHRLQKMLYISLFGQTLSFFAIYLVPLFAVFLVFITNSTSVSSIIVIIFAIINCYELSNYIIIIFTISYFRNFVKRLFLCAKGVKLSFEMTVMTVKPMAIRNARTNLVANNNSMYNVSSVYK